MKTSRLIILAFLLSLMTVHVSEAGSIIYGNTIDVSGGLKLVDGQFCFADNTCMTTAVFSDGSAIWGQISGYIDDQLDLSVKFQTKQDLSEKDLPFGYAGLNAQGHLSINALPALGFVIVNIPVAGTSPVFAVNTEWVEIPEYMVVFTKLNQATKLSLRWTDNIGIYSTSWCNIGIFVDDVPEPVCYGAWSGVEYTTVFGQQHLNCTITGELSGEHVFKVKHRSQFCMYGNYAIDQYGAMRQFIIQELL